MKQSRSNSTHLFFQQLQGLHICSEIQNILSSTSQYGFKPSAPSNWRAWLPGLQEAHNRVLLFKLDQKDRDLRVNTQGVQLNSGIPISILVLQLVPPLCDFWPPDKRNISHFRSVRMNHFNDLDVKHTSLMLVQLNPAQMHWSLHWLELYPHQLNQ